MHIYFDQKTLPLSQSLRIAALSDIHINQHFSDRLSAKLLKSLSRRKFDAIFVLGDLIDRVNVLDSPEITDRALDFFTKLARLAPVFLVYGNHDVMYKERGIYAYEIPRDFRTRLAQIKNLTILDNAVCETKDFCVAGFTPSRAYHFPNKNHHPESRNVLRRDLEAFLAAKCRNLPTTKPRFFLTHSPLHGDLLTQKLTDFDYIFAGHMHNGCLPRWLLWTTRHAGLLGPSDSLFPRYAHGIYKNLIILPPVSTFPSKLHFCQFLYPYYLSLFRFKSDILKP